VQDNRPDEDRARRQSPREPCDDAFARRDWRLRAPFDERLREAVNARAREDREAPRARDDLIAWNRDHWRPRAERFAAVYELKPAAPFRVHGLGDGSSDVKWHDGGLDHLEFFKDLSGRPVVVSQPYLPAWREAQASGLAESIAGRLGLIVTELDGRLAWYPDTPDLPVALLRWNRGAPRGAPYALRRRL
jgi:hypothetical protein